MGTGSLNYEPHNPHTSMGSIYIIATGAIDGLSTLKGDCFPNQTNHHKSCLAQSVAGSQPGMGFGSRIKVIRSG